MTVLCGDCRIVLQSINDSSIDLVYMDPPFFTQKTHALVNRDGNASYSFEDTWDSIETYLAFMREVLIQCKRVLKDTGSIFVHCDRSASHHLRVLLDQIFGPEHFQSEIIWTYRRWSNSKKGLLPAHQTIYFYSKTENFKFNVLFTDYSPTTNIDQILQARTRNEKGKSVYRRDQHGNIVAGKEKKGVPLSDVWYIPFLNPKARERVGYPTQKPVLLLERIIKIATDSGDSVLDPFCGSGTTLVAAKLLGRTYIGIDISREAVSLSEERLRLPIKSESQLLVVGEEGFRMKSDYERNLLKALDAVPVERNSGIDGFLFIDEQPIPIRIQKDDEDIATARQKLKAASRAKQCSSMILIRTKTENNLCLFETEDDDVLVIDAYDLIIRSWLHKRKYRKKTIVP